MIMNKEDNTFKELIQSMGYESAPEGMVMSVLNQLSVEKERQTSSSPILIPKWVWILVIIIVLALLIYTILNPSNAEVFLLSEIIQQMNLFSFEFSFFEHIKIFQNTPKFLIVLIPILIVQFYLMKNYYEGRYI